MANKELIVHSSEEMITIALLEDGILMELSRVEKGGGFAVGDIYLGKIRKVMPGLNAAFVAIGSERDAFVHYLDLGANFKSYAKLLDTLTRRRIFSFSDFPKQKEILKGGQISEVVSSGTPVLVQVTKEAINTKGPRVSTDISLTGRHVVLIPFEKRISISQKIKSNDERNRLKGIVRDILPANYGVIIRTAAIGASYEDILQDIKELVAKWTAMLDTIQTAKNPSLVMSEESRVMTTLRDMLNESFSSVVIDDPLIYHEVKEYIRKIAPDKERIVRNYKGNTPLFDQYDITRQIKGLFGKIVPFRKKSYMVIEQTEALHVIDINSGPRVKNADSQEEIALEVNCNAVEQIARQLRLRDLGGIIVIDFIDMHKAENRQKLFDMMRTAMAGDRAKHTILPLSKFCLMQITRQRVRPATRINNTETCPTCRGTGRIAPSILFDEEMEVQLAALIEEFKLKYIKIKLHPYVYSYLTKGFFSKRLKWMLKYRCYIKLLSNESVGYVDAKYYDKDDCVLSVQSLENYTNNEEDESDGTDDLA